MKKAVLSLILIVFATNLGYTQIINPIKSQVKFKIGNMKLNTVEGSFNGMKGTVKFTEKEFATALFDVCIDAKSVNTNNTKRDNHLRTADFFDVEKYPSICFKSINTTKTSTGYLVKGLLTMHGVTKEVQIPFTYSNNTFIGNITVNRYDYKIGLDTGTFVVDDEAKLTIVCVLN